MITARPIHERAEGMQERDAPDASMHELRIGFEGKPDGPESVLLDECGRSYQFKQTVCCSAAMHYKHISAYLVIYPFIFTDLDIPLQSRIGG